MIVRELINLIKFDVDKKSESKTQQIMSSIGSGMGAALAGLGVGLAALGVIAVKSAAEMESLTSQFTVMLGSAEKAKALVATLRKEAALTPFTLPQLTKAVNTMMQYSVSSDEAVRMMKMMGDVAGNDGEKLQRLAFAFGQVNAAGKLQGQDLRQMIDSGFNPLMVLAKGSTTEMERLRKEMEQGKLSVDKVKEAFKMATSEGGLFYKNMLTQSQTAIGLFSTLKDKGLEFATSIGMELLPSIKEIMTSIINVFSGSESEKLTQAIVAPLKDAVEIIKQLFDSSFMDLVTASLSIIKPVFAILGKLVTGIMPFVNDLIKLIIDLLIPFSAEILKFLDDYIVPVITQDLVPLLQDLIIFLKPILDIIMKVAMWVAKIFFAKKVGEIKMLIKIVQFLLNLIFGISIGLYNAFKPFFDYLYQAFVGVGKFIDDIINGTIKVIFDAMDFIFKIFNDIINFFVKLPGVDRNTLKPTSPNEIVKDIVKNDTKNTKTDIVIKNDISMSGADMNTTAGNKESINRIATSVFSLEMKKVLIKGLNNG